MALSPPPLDSPSWGVIQWAITSFFGAILGIGGYLMRSNGKVTLHTSELAHQKEHIERLLADISGLEKQIAARPTHEDIAKLIHFMQNTIEARFDSLDQRFSQMSERIDTFISRR